MYNLNYVYLEVKMDKKDYTLRDLIDDLEAWSTHLYPVERKNSIVYRGLVKKKEFEHISLLKAMSPYGAGYTIKVDGVPFEEYGCYSWKVVRGIV